MSNCDAAKAVRKIMPLAKKHSVAAELSKMYQTGKLNRVRPGIYEWAA